MCLKLYQVVLKAQSPIHIGFGRLGYIQRTRHYLPGKSLWGAVTEALTNSLFDNPQFESPQYPDYIAIGDIIKENFKFSYFYITLNAKDLSKKLIPNLKSNPPGYGLTDSSKEPLFSQMEFESTFISGFGSTAIKPDSQSAEEETLHAMEFLNHLVSYENKLHPVYFSGYLWARAGDYALGDAKKRLISQCATDDIAFCLKKIDEKGEKEVESNTTLQKVLNYFQIGGEKAYGGGMLRLLHPLREMEPDSSLWGRYSTKLEGKPLILVSKGEPIPAHLFVDTSQPAQPNAIKIHGDLEPLTGREYKEGEGVGRHLVCPGVYYVPGSIVKKIAKKGELRLEIGDYGTLLSGVSK